jgi:hypothetical protein
MKIRTLIFAVLLGISAVGSVKASYFTAGYLLPICESEVGDTVEDCRLYLAGIVDATITLYAWKFLTVNITCVPKGVTLDQIRIVFIKHANERPQELHTAASSMALNAFSKAFPCE